MKNRAFLLLAFLCFSTPLLAQGTLQFNQVLFLQSSAANTVLLGTVPAGKVWKIEHVGGVPTTCYCNFSFNGQNIAFGVGGMQVGNTLERFQNEGMVLPPIWLPAGTPITAFNCGNCFMCQNWSCTNPYRYLSIIEFNVIP